MVNLNSESDLNQLNCLLPQSGVDGGKWPVPAGLLEEASPNGLFVCSKND